MTAKQISMTKGKPFKLIFFFMVPVLLGNIFQQFYSIVDSMIVGQLLGVEAFAGVSVASTAMFIPNSLLMGFSAKVWSREQGWGQEMRRDFSIYGNCCCGCTNFDYGLDFRVFFDFDEHSR